MNNLLPPYELWLVETSAIIFLLLLINNSPEKLSRKKVFGITGIISGLLAVTVSIFWRAGMLGAYPVYWGSLLL